MGTKSEVAHKWAGWLHNPFRLRVPIASKGGDKIKVAHKWAVWLHDHTHLWGPHYFREREKVRGGPPQVGGLLHHPGRLHGAQRFNAPNKTRGGQQVGRLAT